MRGLCTIYIPSSFLFGVIFLSINKVSWEPLEGFPFPLLSLDWGSEGGSFGSIKTIGRMGAVDYDCIYDRTLINAANPLLLELLIQFFPGVYP
mgnify:CR=1 FL=1